MAGDRILVDISSHGWGHLAQTAPIIGAVRARHPGLEVVVRSAIDGHILRDRLGSDIVHIRSDSDFGLKMKDPFSVDTAATLDSYRSLHAQLNRHVATIAKIVGDLECRVVFSNISYLAIAGARRAKVPAIACSSLNWHDIFGAYCGAMPGADAICDDMRQAYREADVFFRLAPGMPMPAFDTTAVTRPIASRGRARRRELRDRLGVAAASPVILCAFGGMLPRDIPPFLKVAGSFVAIGPSAWVETGCDLVPADTTGMDFLDLLSSVDVVISKAGYGIVSELGCSGTPAILVSRNDWPEEPYLLAWLEKWSHVALVANLSDLTSELLAGMLAALAKPEPRPAAQAGGEIEVANCILARLGSESAG